MLLFNSSQPTLKETLLKITTSQINQGCTTTSYQRGNGYQRNGSVSDVNMTRENKLTASVSGSDEYEVIIEQNNRQVIGNCDCPYDLSGACKHIVAVLLEAMVNKKKIENFEPMTELNIKTILLSKTKEELAAWVMDYAPNDFLDRLRHSMTVLAAANNPVMHATPRSLNFPTISAIESTPTTVKQVRTAAKSLRALFKDDDIVSNSAIFERKLMKILNGLRSIWYHESDEMNALLCEVVENISKAQEEGHLSDEEGYEGYDYDDDSSIFEDTALVEYMKSFASTLPMQERLFFLQDVNVPQAISTIVIEDVFQSSEFLALKEMYMKEGVQARNERVYTDLSVYRIIEFTLSEAEWFLVAQLIYLKDEPVCLRLVKFYEEKGDFSQAFQTCKNYVAKHTDTPYNRLSEAFYDEYILLARNNHEPFAAITNEYMTKYPNENTLAKIMTYSPAEHREAYESIMERMNPTNFLQYLENKGRVAEAYNFLNKIGGYFYSVNQFAFLERQGKHFPEDAINLFEATIKENEQHTGDKYYDILVKCILAIKAVDKDLAKEKWLYLLSSYSRRPNLMAKLRTIKF
jgi:hypothetical protein